jgi:hypothetical protein
MLSDLNLLLASMLSIDSLCISQYGDKLEDWRKETRRMGAVFGNAYFTIPYDSLLHSASRFVELVYF